MLEGKEVGKIKCDEGIDVLSVFIKSLPFLGVCCSVLNMVASNFKAFARVPSEKKHILCFFLINNIAMVNEKFGPVLFLFYQF
jgi:hypothetical protein